ncbi:MAG: hypothetical protein ACK54L_05615 [Betaproteobacteria bacterium]
MKAAWRPADQYVVVKILRGQRCGGIAERVFPLKNRGCAAKTVRFASEKRLLVREFRS